jgi:hypothetical protein
MLGLKVYKSLSLKRELRSLACNTALTNFVRCLSEETVQEIGTTEGTLAEIRYTAGLRKADSQ